VIDFICIGGRPAAVAVCASAGAIAAIVARAAADKSKLFIKHLQANPPKG
jgi:hypothetical protein